jgi:hypothetical protein
MVLDEDRHPLVAVHECWSDGEAAVVVSCLRAHGIDAVTDSESIRSVIPVTVDGLGRIEVLVRGTDAGAAKFILKERAAGSDEQGPPSDQI